MCSGTFPHHILDSPVQEQHFNSNEDVHMDDSIPGPSFNTFIIDNMDKHHTQQSPLKTRFQSSQSVDEISSAEVTSFIDRIHSEYPSPYGDIHVESSGDEPMHNSTYGSYCQTPAYLSDIYGDSSAYPPGLPSHGFQQMPSTPAVHYPTPTSIPHTAEPEVRSPKTPTKSTTSIRRVRKSRRGSQNKQKKEFSCRYCGRVSTCASNLEEHVLTHTGVKDYLCTYSNENGKTCLKRFARPWGLTRHCNDVHKIDVEVTKGGEMKILGRFTGHGGPKISKRNNTKAPPRGHPSLSVTANKDSPSPSPYIPPLTVDRISITTSGPEGGCYCAICNRPFARSNELMIHNHVHHELPLSSYCCCNLCSFDNSISGSPVNTTSSLSNFYGSGDDQMEVEVPEYDMKIDPKLLTPGVEDFSMMNTCPSPVAEDSTTTASAQIDPFFSTSSPVLSTFFMDEDTPIPTPVEPLPRVEMNSSPWCENDIVTFTSDGFPIHNCPSVSTTSFYGLMGLDYNNMTDEERHSYLGGAWK